MTNVFATEASMKGVTVEAIITHSTSEKSRPRAQNLLFSTTKTAPLPKFPESPQSPRPGNHSRRLARWIAPAWLSVISRMENYATFGSQQVVKIDENGNTRVMKSA